MTIFTNVPDIPKAIIARAETMASRLSPELRLKYKGYLYRCCAVCGAMDWVQSTNQFEGVKVELTADECHICNQAKTRNPELTEWAWGVQFMARAEWMNRVAKLETRVSELEARLNAVIRGL